MLSNEKQLRQKQFDVHGSCFGGCLSDSERCLWEDFEDVVGLSSPDMVFFNKLLNGLASNVCGIVRIKEELQELAEERVESFVLGRERDEVRPASCDKVSDLRAEGDVVLDELVACAQQPAHSNDLRRRQLQALKAVAVGSESVGENEGVAPVVLGAAHRMPVTEAVDLLGIDGENGDGAVKKDLDNGPMRFFDRHRDALAVL